MINSITSFNKAVQKATEWLNELKDIGQFETEEQAYTALRSVLHALRNRLVPDEAVHLASELPMLVRGFFYEGFDIKQPDPKAGLEEFLNDISREMRNASFKIPPEKAAKAVFVLLQNKISEGEFKDAICSLPLEIRQALLS